MLIGRSTELKNLNTYYEREGSKILVLYGQKGIGKTTLLKEFVQDKPYYYYKCRMASEREQLFEWGLDLNRDQVKTLRFPDYMEIFSAITRTATGKKVIIIDEFQYIIKYSADFMKQLIEFVHQKWEAQPLLIILCSSSIDWVENSMLDKIGTAAYELSGLVKLKELRFQDLVERFPGFSMEECIEAYAILGGVPRLWNYFDDKLSIPDNIMHNILNKNSFLYEEGTRMVADELREIGVYSTILSCLAAGSHKLNDLYEHTGFSRAKISVYIKNLMELELVEKVFSFDAAGRENVQKGVYRVSNHFVDFFYTYLYSNATKLEWMSEKEFYNEYIAPTFKKYVSEYFKLVVRERLARKNSYGSLPIKLENYGEWVGKTGTIDFVGVDKDGKYMVCICNWEKPMMRYDDYEWLLYSLEQAKIKADYIYLYSASRFDEKLNLEAKVKTNLKLVTIDQI